MPAPRSISIVGVHAEGEIGDVVVGGVLDPTGCSSMYEKLVYFRDKADDTRQLLMQEPRGRSSQCMNLILAPCDPRADAAFLTMESDEYPPMSGANTIATTTVLLETGMVEMKEPTTRLSLDTAAGLIGVTADCEGGKCKAVAFDNVPSFVHVLDLKVEVPGLGTVSVDIAWGGMHYVLVDAPSVGLAIRNECGADLVRVGEKIKRAVQDAYTPVHPENPDIRGVTVLEFTEPLEDGPENSKTAINTVIVSPGRLDRSPCGTGTCARMAVLHARGQLKEGETFRHRSIIGTEFICQIRGTTKVGEFNAVHPRVKGRAWLTGFGQSTLDPTDPFPVGYRVGDHWHIPGHDGQA
ncbi:proline racemase A precursor [Lasiodiplodia theobromae]|nr:proline racemase A precursor [Lasiodiplodia theobromae]